MDHNLPIPNLPNRGVSRVNRNLPNEQKPDRWDGQPVARNPKMEALLLRVTQRPQGLIGSEASLYTPALVGLNA